jgi:DNA primase
LRKQDEADAKTAASVLLPEPRVYSWSEWPEEFRLWLLKAGLSAHDSGQLGVYYHPPTNRAVLPVLGPSGHPVFWQARALRGRLPKYLAPAVDKTTVLPVYGKATEVTLTEDILSAYKVGTVAEGWAMMGTSLSKHCLAKLINRGCKVNVWLDPDTAGRKAAKAVLATLRGAGLEARQIHSAKDPKLIHRQYIKEILS